MDESDFLSKTSTGHAPMVDSLRFCRASTLRLKGIRGCFFAALLLVLLGLRPKPRRFALAIAQPNPARAPLASDDAA